MQTHQKIVKVKGSDKRQRKAIQAYAITYEPNFTNRSEILIDKILEIYPSLINDKFGYEDTSLEADPDIIKNMIWKKIVVDEEDIGAELIFLSN